MPLPSTASSTLSPPTEWGQLLEAARAGDDDALGQICQRFREHLLLTADDGLGGELRAKLGASDVVQQSMLEVHNDFRRFAGESEQEFRRWITRLVERNLIDSARQFRQTQRRDIRRERPIEPNTSGTLASSNPSPRVRGRQVAFFASRKKTESWVRPLRGFRSASDRSLNFDIDKVFRLIKLQTN